VQKRQNQQESANALVASAQKLREAVNRLRFASPVEYVYNPLDYAWEVHELYLRFYGNNRKRVMFVGMNPGPFGMVQTGVPFGQVAAVRDWLKIGGRIRPPLKQHPKRLVTGFACARSEISGERLWGLFAARYGTATAFFADHFVANYCPLAFVEESGRNRTPDKLPGKERDALFAACDQHLREAVIALEPEWLVGIGDFAAGRIRGIFDEGNVKLGRILHPSPASPASNKDWQGTVTAQLQQLRVWA
jgi:single-strand selective monofunctional uracil DNA glycosylase